MSTDEPENYFQRWRNELREIEEIIAKLEAGQGEFRQDTYKIGELKRRRAVVVDNLKAHGQEP